MEESLQFSSGNSRLYSVKLAKNCKELVKTSTLRSPELGNAVSLCWGAQPVCWLRKHLLEKLPALEEQPLMLGLVALLPVCDIPLLPPGFLLLTAAAVMNKSLYN